MSHTMHNSQVKTKRLKFKTYAILFSAFAPLLCSSFIGSVPASFQYHSICVPNYPILSISQLTILLNSV